MPVSRHADNVHNPTTPTNGSLPNQLRPYTHHGVELAVRSSHGVGDCPFCGKDNKFSVDITTGLWRCFVCGSGTSAGGGNALVFLRLLHERSLARTFGIQDASAGRDGGIGRPPYPARDRVSTNGVGPNSAIPPFVATVAADRRLLDPATISGWGVCQSAIDNTWLIPGYGPDGKLDQLYRRTWVEGKYLLLPTPGVWPEGKVHALHLPVGDFDRARSIINVCEGPWDGMAMWETVGSRPDCNIIAVPGCNVWRDEWTEMCRGKHVVLWYDSDHPLEEALRQGRTVRPGFDGMCRVAKRLSGVAASVKFIRWGSEGYDPDKPTGWDLRDHLGQADDLAGRKALLSELLGKIEDAPRDWFSSSQVLITSGSSQQAETLESMACQAWLECENAWTKAIRWRQDLSDALAVTLAACASTKQGGNQLFMDFVGSPGVAKTTILRGALVSHHCVHVENITKIMSGYKKPGEDSVDCSFLARSNNKTWITCEFDVVLSSPHYHDLMGKMRRIFDGETSATYGNSDEDRLYRALRTPWLRAGTWKMMHQDQSQLGDRFLRFIINDPAEKEKRDIIRSAIRSERSAILETSNGTTGSILDPETRLAYGLTGGYIDWLRANIEEKLPTIAMSPQAEDECIDLAELSADLRARPITDKRRGTNSEDASSFSFKELPARLARQNVRLALCLAVVQNKTSVDNEVMRIVSKVALDTSYGHSLDIVKWLSSANPKSPERSYHDCGGFTENALSLWTKMSQERMLAYLQFLEGVDVVKHVTVHGRTQWILTDRMYDLYRRVML